MLEWTDAGAYVSDAERDLRAKSYGSVAKKKAVPTKVRPGFWIRGNQEKMNHNLILSPTSKLNLSSCLKVPEPSIFRPQVGVLFLLFPANETPKQFLLSPEQKAAVLERRVWEKDSRIWLAG